MPPTESTEPPGADSTFRLTAFLSVLAVPFCLFAALGTGEMCSRRPEWALSCGPVLAWFVYAGPLLIPLVACGLSRVAIHLGAPAGRRWVVAAWAVLVAGAPLWLLLTPLR